MTTRTATLASLLVGLLAAGPVHADASADLKAAYGKFIQATSFRATMTDLESGREVNRIEFVAPDRYAITPAASGMRQLIIGRTMHMDIGGRALAIPLPDKANPGQYRNQKALDELAAGIAVRQEADAEVAGEPAKVYHFVSQAEGKPVETLTFVSKASGLPVQIQTTGSSGGTRFRYQIRYSHFNDPAIVITAPK